jgi:hypothetical protein
MGWRVEFVSAVLVTILATCASKGTSTKTGAPAD